jgi:hypothetical protein
MLFLCTVTLERSALGRVICKGRRRLTKLIQNSKFKIQNSKFHFAARLTGQNLMSGLGAA